jgi:predicted TIM-barrel fold metal-dependent hydrolase
MPGYWKNDPVDTLRRHVWINPFWEDDVTVVAECMGTDRVIFGSDWPHVEGLPEPLDYVRELKGFDTDETRRILLDNVQELLTLRPTA